MPSKKCKYKSSAALDAALAKRYPGLFFKTGVRIKKHWLGGLLNASSWTRYRFQGDSIEQDAKLLEDICKALKIGFDEIVYLRVKEHFDQDECVLKITDSGKNTGLRDALEYYAKYSPMIQDYINKCQHPYVKGFTEIMPLDGLLLEVPKTASKGWSLGERLDI